MGGEHIGETIDGITVHTCTLHHLYPAKYCKFLATRQFVSR